MPTNPVQRSSTTVAEAQRRLSKLDELVKTAQAPDGSVDLVRVRQLAGSDRGVSRMVTDLKWDRERTTLSPAELKQQFLQLQQAISSIGAHDANGDGKLGFSEVPYSHPDTRAQSLMMRASLPLELSWTESATPRQFVSLQARREMDGVIVERAAHHAATPAGQEALKWAMRLSLAEGAGLDHFRMTDVINFAETSWQKNLPFIGEKHRSGKGHLSDGELKGYLGKDLAAYPAYAQERIRAVLLMDYPAFLAGTDLK